MKLATLAARRLPNITLRPRVILPMVVGFFLVCWAGFMVGSVRGPDNLGFVMLRGSGGKARKLTSFSVMYTRLTGSARRSKSACVSVMS